jgi:hypothetical protein
MLLQVQIMLQPLGLIGYRGGLGSFDFPILYSRFPSSEYEIAASAAKGNPYPMSYSVISKAQTSKDRLLLACCGDSEYDNGFFPSWPRIPFFFSIG